MASYDATARTSYTKVKDEESFREWASTLPGTRLISKESKEDGELFGLLFDGGIPNFRPSDDAEDGYVELDVYADIQNHISEGWAITFMEVGAEAYRYLTGAVSVVTPDTQEHYDISQWASETMSRLGGPKHTLCEY